MKAAIKPEPTALLGPYLLVPKVGETDIWAIPGRWFATSGELMLLAARNNWNLQFFNKE